MRFDSLVDALENNKNYKKGIVEVYGIAYSSWGEAYFMNIAWDNEDEAFEYFKENYVKNGTDKYLKVRKMTYNKYGGIDIGWENGSICYRNDVKYR